MSPSPCFLKCRQVAKPRMASIYLNGWSSGQKQRDRNFVVATKFEIAIFTLGSLKLTPRWFEMSDNSNIIYLNPDTINATPEVLVCAALSSHCWNLTYSQSSPQSLSPSLLYNYAPCFPVQRTLHLSLRPSLRLSPVSFQPLLGKICRN
jgi:hypothetical protein